MATTLRGTDTASPLVLGPIARALAAASRPECVDCGEPARIRTAAGPSCGQFGCPTERVSPFETRRRAGLLPAGDITGSGQWSDR